MSLSAKQQADFIGDACERNLPVELHRQSISGELVTYRGRFLRETTGSRLLEIEMPKRDWGGEKPLEPGHVLTAYVVTESGVHSFLCEVREAKRGLELNESKKVEGLVVDRLGEVTASQRRNAYRITLAGNYDIRAEIHVATSTKPYASPIDAFRIRGEVIESSATGLGVMVNENIERSVRRGDMVFVTFGAAPGEEAFCFLTEVRHVAVMFEGEKTRLGLKITHWPGKPVFGREIFRFERFINEVERERLRRIAG